MIDPDRPADEPQVPQSGPEGEPDFEEPGGPAPAVDDPPGRSTEF